MGFMNNQALAQRFCSAFGRRLLYDQEAKMFWWFGSDIWKPLDQDALEDLIAEFCDTLDMKKNLTTAIYKDVAEQCRRRARKVEYLDDKYISFTDCLLLPDSMATFPKPPEPKTVEWKVKEELGGFDAGGVYTNVYTERIATIHIPVEYAKIKEATMPLFENYIDFATYDTDKGEPDPKMKDLLQEWAGYMLSSANATKCLICYGDGGTGKSVYLAALRHLLSPARCSASGLNQLTKKDFYLNSLIGKKAVITDEEETKTSDLAKVKKIIDGNWLSDRRLYKSALDFRLRVKMCFGSNKFPYFEGFDNSVKRRFIIADFNNKIADDKRDVLLGEKLKNELPAIVAWALEGLVRLQKNNWTFTEPERAKANMEELRMTCSSVAEYLRDRFVVDDESKKPFKEVYGEYADWCKDNRRIPVSSNRFTREAIDVIGKTSMIWVGGKPVKGYKIRSVDEEPQRKTVFD